MPKGLELLTQLKRLALDDNQLTDVTGLEKLTQLTTLEFQENKLIDVQGLEKLNQLTKLNLNFNPDLTKAQIAQLQNTLPKCKIASTPKTSFLLIKILERLGNLNARPEDGGSP